MRIEDTTRRRDLREYHSTDEACVFTGFVNSDVVESCSRTFRDGYDCSASLQVTLTKQEVLNICKIAKSKGWL
jgi:hypothetical protein